MPGYITGSAAFEAVRKAKVVASTSAELRNEARTYCVGVIRGLKAVSTLTPVDAYIKALSLTSTLLSLETMNGLEKQAAGLRDVVVQLRVAEKAAA